MRLHRRRKPVIVPGAPPGTLIHNPEALAPVVRAICFGPDAIEERDLTDLEEVGVLRERFPVVWIDVVGLGDADLVRVLGEEFGLHPLALEDVMHTHQRAKAEAYDDHLFLVFWLLRWSEQLEFEQISVFFGEGYILSFQERPGDCFDPVRHRLRLGNGRIRGRGPDYLAYALLDAVIDSYFLLLDGYAERLEELEDRILEHPGMETASHILIVKRELQAVRRAVWPLRETLATLLREEDPRIHDSTYPYFRDCHDHALQTLEMTETCRERCSDLVNLVQSCLGNQMNQVMKVLTIIATIFIPLTFVAGVYGMNFDPAVSPFNMPELGWYLGYPFAMGLMLILGVIMLLLFRRRGWL